MARVWMLEYCLPPAQCLTQLPSLSWSSERLLHSEEVKAWEQNCSWRGPIGAARKRPANGADTTFLMTTRSKFQGPIQSLNVSCGFESSSWLSLQICAIVYCDVYEYVWHSVNSSTHIRVYYHSIIVVCCICCSAVSCEIKDVLGLVYDRLNTMTYFHINRTIDLPVPVHSIHSTSTW